MTEFTGERVIPGQVHDDLWAEHVARYALATRYADVGRALDLGCGSGYGVADLAQRAKFVAGIDVAPDAIAYARAHYPLPHAHFLCASATAVPFQTGSFHLVTAFEVIEHLSDWRCLLEEARRVLHSDGVFLVSTPNKLYYAESRAETGPNPFHTHEFEFGEFREALVRHFPQVTILLQNRVEAFAFYPHATFLPAETRMDGTRGTPEEAHFFIGVCSLERAPEIRTFFYVPRASNLLRERELHIESLKSELEKITADRQELLRLHTEQTSHLEERNRWALEVENEWRAAQRRIVELQNDFQSEQAKAAAAVANLERENAAKTAWARDTEARLAAKCEELAEAVRLLDTAEATVTERTTLAQQLRARLDEAETQLNLLRGSRWLKLGQAVGVGPNLEGNTRAKDGD